MMQSRRTARGAASSKTMVATSGAIHADPRHWAFAEMRPQDLRQVLAIERGSFDNPWSSALFLQELRIPFSRIVVVRPAGGADEPIVGYLCRWFVADEIHVLNVAVHPAHRGRGIGTLVAEALREARRGRADAMTLEVRRSNEAARRLYASFGFEEVGVRRNYYGRGEDALIMRLALPRG
jgi:ribosomal-protein-alanine N-acetyltransferase